MAHYYTLHGEACHTQPTVSPEAKNEERKTNIADAKKQKLLPSVTTYIDLRANEAIVQARLKDIAKACYENPPIYDETFDGWYKNMQLKANTEGKKAMQLGTDIHAAIEAHYTDRPYDFKWDAYVRPTVEVVSTLGIVPLEHEKVLVNAKEGYAGTTDMTFSYSGGSGILDYKSQKFQKKPNEYDSYTWQLAAYHMAQYGAILDGDVGYNIYISTATPGLVVPVKRTADELRHGWEVFSGLLSQYRLTSGFDPRQ
jgi:hypothetical protein